MTLSEAAARNLRSAAIGTLKQREKDRLVRKHRKQFAAFFRRQKVMVLEEMNKRRERDPTPKKEES